MSQRGLTLLELLIALAIAAIVLHLALPSFTRMIATHRQQVAGNELLSALRSARTLAILRQQAVIIDPLEGQWGKGWRVVADASGQGLQDPDNPLLLVRQHSGDTRIVGNTRLAQWVRFTALGAPSYAGSSPGNGTLFVCDTGTGRTHSRVILGVSGRVRLEAGPGSAEPCALAEGLDAQFLGHGKSDVFRPA
jgi:type IV fimbrial biogenesis protein FimT